MQKSLLLISILYFLSSIFSSDGIRLIIVNNCADPIWPALLGTAGHPTPAGGGFALGSGQQASVDTPDLWSGRVWARTGCRFDASDRGPCETGGCNGRLGCAGAGGRPPATVVEVTLGTAADPVTHYYDVSLVDGFNLPASMVPAAGGGAAACGVAACEADVNACCPENLAEMGQGGRVVGCKSACVATGEDKYCCKGEYGNPRACKPTSYANLFKALCPRANSYAFDEAGGFKSCNRAKRYVITFCPPN